MKKRSNDITITLLAIACVLILISVILYFTLLKMYVYITLTLLIIDLIVLIIHKKNTKSENARFKSKVKSIINTYDSILAKIDILPDLSDKDIIYIPKFEELINAQGETKKPIFYSVNDKTASFVLIDNNLVCYSIIKENDNFIDPIESKLKTINGKRKKENIDESILADLDKTTIIKLPNIGSYKVSPIRKKEVTFESLNKRIYDDIVLPKTKKEVISEVIDETKDDDKVFQNNHVMEWAKNIEKKIKTVG